MPRYKTVKIVYLAQLTHRQRVEIIHTVYNDEEPTSRSYQTRLVRTMLNGVEVAAIITCELCDLLLDTGNETILIGNSTVKIDRGRALTLLNIKTNGLARPFCLTHEDIDKIKTAFASLCFLRALAGAKSRISFDFDGDEEEEREKRYAAAEARVGIKIPRFDRTAVHVAKTCDDLVDGILKSV